MPQYLLSVCISSSDAPPPAEDFDAIHKAVFAFNDRLGEDMRFAGGLLPPDTATVVDARGDSVTMTDGPFQELTDFVGGFWVVRADDADAALELAKEASAACRARVEVRPFEDEDQAAAIEDRVRSA